MLKYFSSKSEFSRNVLTLMTGTIVAQAIPLAISPILTRIYSPEDFGIFALFMSITSILATVITGKYELAILLPKKDEDAINILSLSIALTFVISILVLIVVFIFNSKIVSLLGNPDISNWLYFIPISLILTGLLQNLNSWNNRKKYYNTLAKCSVIKSIGSSSVNLSLGIMKFGSMGLIIGSLLGNSLAITTLGSSLWKKDHKLFKEIKKQKIFHMAKRYIKFPKFLIFSSAIDTASQQMPILIFSSLFNATIVGFYTLTKRVVELPMLIISKSIGDVFRQEASVKYISDGECRKVYFLTFKKLLFISIIPFVIFFLIAPNLFSFIFGNEWKVAGEYAQILAPMYFLRFIASPLSIMFIIAEKQKFDLIWKASLFIGLAVSIFIGYYFFQTINGTLLSFVIVYCIAYLVNLSLSFNFSKGNHEKNNIIL